MTLVDPITAAALRTDFQAVLTSIQAISSSLYTYNLHLASLADTTELRDRTLRWTQQDDVDLELFHLRVTDSGGAARVVTGTLTVDNGDTIYLAEQTVSLSVTSTAGTQDSRTSYATVTGTRIRLLRGVRYRMTLSNATVGTVTGPVILNTVVRFVQRRQ